MSNSTEIFNADIDLVYLWVDGNDAAWVAKKNRFLGKDIDPNTDATTKGRIANNDELRYSLRSVEKYAPWIRNIFIVTDEQKPDWLNPNNTRIRIIDIREILPPEALPCYNSVIIEHFLYKIPGLAEHFLYANDDMFLNAPVTPDKFFNQAGQAIVRMTPAPFGKWINLLKRTFGIYSNVYRKTIDNAARLIERKFGTYYTSIPHHNMDAYLKSDHQKVVEKDFVEEIAATITHHIRSDKDIQRVIYSYYALANNRGKRHFTSRKESCRIRLQEPDFMRFITKYNPIFFCLNDSRRATDDDRARIKPFLEALFPEKSEFELE